MNGPHSWAGWRRGQAFTEYALAVAALVLVALVAVSVLSKKQGEQVALGVASAPGQHPGDNGPLRSGELLPTAESSNDTLILDFEQITEDNDGATSRFGESLGAGEELEQWVVPVYPN